ncbi:MAG: NAD(P)/FAD-dependent oxidoreductase [Zoogloeaceae bacterium]|jgi:thioredoxin reductase|nr:NAD(P)/FAD-dependent oxidoreductase [Zoogloeaceae bacterium]
MMEKLRVAILGAGPAGLSAGLWLKNLGFEPILLERSGQPGGLPNLNFLRNNWVLGHVSVTGQTLSQRFCAHAHAAGVEIHLDARPVALAPLPSGAAELSFGDGVSALAVYAVIVATGSRYRGPEILGKPLADALRNSGRIACGPYAFCDMAKLAGQHVLIVGGGDNACENARLLLDAGVKTTLVARSRLRARRQMSDAITADANCAIHEESHIRDIAPANATLSVLIARSDGTERRLSVDRVHILAGYEPNTAFLRDLLPARWHALLGMDAAGYLQTDAWGRTTVPGIYAVGDVANPEFPSVVSAIAQGAKTAKILEQDLRGAPLFPLSGTT